jgi:hypothetical protein
MDVLWMGLQVVRCMATLRCFCEVCAVWRFVAFCGLLWRFVAFCGVLWRFVAFCGVLWRFVAFCGFLAIWVVPGKLKFFVKSFGRDHLIVSNGKTGKCHFVAGDGQSKMMEDCDSGLWMVEVDTVFPGA